jgi:Zn-finger nucleic acid-binding protein
MDCPRCTRPLKEVDLGEFGGEYASVKIDLCPDCEGVWLDKGELDERDESVWTDAEALDFQAAPGTGPSQACPRCSVGLARISPTELLGLVVERCPSCLGFWLDAGEVEAVQHLTAELDSATMDDMTHLLRPPDWSWLKWAVHCARRHYQRP